MVKQFNSVTTVQVAKGFIGRLSLQMHLEQTERQQISDFKFNQMEFLWPAPLK